MRFEPSRETTSGWRKYYDFDKRFLLEVEPGFNALRNV
jgi:hypothetical protein